MLRRRPVSATLDPATAPLLDWSTSYQAGSSSSGSQSSDSSLDDDETEDESFLPLRGRQHSTNKQSSDESQKPQMLLAKPRPSACHTSSRDSTGNGLGPSFTRSRSPAANKLSEKPSKKGQRTMSPPTTFLSRFTLMSPATVRTILPTAVELQVHLWPSPWTWVIHADARRVGECLILLGSVLSASKKLSAFSHISFMVHKENNSWVSLELWLLGITSLLYFTWVHSTISRQTSKSILSFPITAQLLHTIPARSTDARESKRTPVPAGSIRKTDFGFIWMSVPKNYRDSSDDGLLTALLLGPLIASALLFVALQELDSSSSPLPVGWLIEAPLLLSNGCGGPSTPLGALILSRLNLVDISTFCSAILLFDVCASCWLEARYSKRANTPDDERGSVPRSEVLRGWYYVLFTIGVSCGLLGIKSLLEHVGYGVWQNMNLFEVVVCSLFYQFTLYAALRLAHRSFTLGELGLVCYGGTSLFMESLNITIARIWPVTTPYIKTYRLPTPLLTFQVALIAGSFLTGFMLSPFLVLSRHIAQRPVRRLRYPEEKQRHRRYLALGFYIGAVLIIGGLIGMWTRWCLGKRDPWLWVLFYLLEGRRKWSRPALLAYWSLLGSISVAGWNRQLARSRRHRSRAATSESSMAPVLDTGAPTVDNGRPPTPPTAAGGTLGLGFPALPNLTNLPNLPTGTNVSAVATDLLDAADKHVPTLGLNARRKFFHALAVVMFVPGIAIDPAFTHLSFSVAFALFTFAEYVRYFAVYPFGAAIHVFMNDFLDHKDSGTAILSHFYLLTGCAGSVWLESPSPLSQFTGTLALGVGDALASIVGKRMGTHRWSSTTHKTLEGSAAYTISVVLCAWLLRICGVVEAFSTFRYAAVVSISSVLEALSVQNDNLTLPLFMWSLLALAN